MRYLSLLLAVFVLAGCNSVYLKPNTLDKGQVVYADRGGYTMRRAIKQRMEKRGYNVVVGEAESDRNTDDAEGDGVDIEVTSVPDTARYVVRVRERKERFAPTWCVFNGFWWWRFNVSIADQKTGEELLAWFGYGCANSSLRKLDRILDKLEMRDE